MSLLATDRQARRNPFASRNLRPGALPFLFADGQTAAELVDRLQTQRLCGQIIGPHGSGKSTLLHAVAVELEAAGYQLMLVRLNGHQRTLPLLPDEPRVLLVDGYEQLSWWSRRQLRSVCRATGHGLVVTAHADAGLTDLYRTSIDEWLAAEIIARLLDKSHVVDSTVRVGLTYELGRRLQAHSFNLREVLFELYDVYQADHC